MEKKFWMVYVEEGEGPTHKYPHLYLAEDEAARLVKETCKAVYVLEAIKSCYLSKVVWEDRDHRIE